MPKPIHIFRAGTHTAASGDTLAFSETDLEASAKAYNPSLHEAPLVVGHPKDNAPAYGWVKALSFSEGNLEAEPDQIDPDFAEMVRAGRFKKVSASFYRPDAPANPAPGSYYLRHVGFLGAQPPAIKGLRGLEFASGETADDLIEFEEDVEDFASPWGTKAIAGVFRRLREYLIEKDGKEKADDIIPEYSVADLEDDARNELEDDLAAPGFSEGDDPQTDNPTEGQAMPLTAEQIQAREDELAARENAIKAREDAVQAAASAQAQAAAQDYAEGLASRGVITAAQAPKVAAVMVALGNAGEIDFAEGDAEPKPTQAAGLLRAVLDDLKPAVDFAERSGEDKAGAGMTEKEITANARAYVREQKEAGNTVSYSEAVRHVTAGLVG